MRLFILTIIFLMLDSLGVDAQNVMFLSSKQGLSNSRVRNITEDSRHNIWVTTQNGLNRYDGVKMNVYRHEIGNPSSLLSDESTCVFEYEKGKMLVGTGAGVQMYDYATDKFANIPFVREGGDTIKARVMSINRVKEKRVLVCFAGYGNGELLKDKKGQFYIKHTTEFDTDGIGSMRLYEDPKKTLWVINGRGDLYRQTSKTFRKYEELSLLRNICVSSSGKLYAATYNNGFYVYNSGEDRYELVASTAELGGAVLNIKPWTLGRLFISTDGGGVRVYDEQTKQLVQNFISVKDFDMATSNVPDATYDSFGNVWVGVYMKGVVMKPINQSAFD